MISLSERLNQKLKLPTVLNVYVHGELVTPLRVEVENECILHNFGFFVIFSPQIVKIGGNLTKF